MGDPRPIGVFDSGIGGLTVVRELKKQLPNETIIYFGDTARVPYGNKSPETVVRYSIEAANLLLTYNIKAFIIACNTASAHGVDILKKKLDIPVFGVIQPGVDSALAHSSKKKILVIGTQGTIRSQAYQKRLQQSGEQLEIFAQPCPLFVPLVEEGWLENEVAFLTISRYLSQYKEIGIDTVILGCTHYPLLKKTIGTYWQDVQLVDSGVETAKVVSRFLRENSMTANAKNESKCRFLVSDIAENFVTIGKNFLNSQMENVEIIDMEKFLAENNLLNEAFFRI